MINKKLHNTYYSISNNIKGNSISNDIIIVEIDDRTLELGKELGRFPFDRKVYAPIIERLREEGAAVIGFDIFFSEESDKKSDSIFREAIKKAGNVVIGSYFIRDNVFVNGIFNDEIKYTGFYQPILDEYNHVVYSFKPFEEGKNGKYYDFFSIAVLKSFYSYIYDYDFPNKEPTYDDNYYYFFEDKKIPFSKKGSDDILVNFIKSDLYRSNESKNSVSFIDIYDESYFNELKKNIDFKDKIVLIGTSAVGIKDIFYTPNGIDPGVYIHANVINTILTKNFIRYLDLNLEYFLLFLLIIITVYFNYVRFGKIIIFSNIAIIFLFLALLPFFLFYFTGYLFNFPIGLWISFVLSLILSNIVKYYVESKNKTKLNKALSEYVSEDVAKEILSGEGKINLNGENKKIAIFFSDIAGFTTISEKLSPEELVSFLREYLTEMSNIIMDEKGFINKYEGDAIMALWGVFGNDGIETYRICTAALKQQHLLDKLNLKWNNRPFLNIKVRMGIHIGDAIIGNIGAIGRKMEFTALGDSVNLASRLEGVNKFYGTYICVSEDIYEVEKNSFEFRYLDNIRVKGKKKPIKIYELVCLKGNITEEQKELFFNYKIAINLYKNKQFKEALQLFEKLANQNDGPSITYKERCEFYINNPPSEHWDGVWTMTSK